MLFALIMMIYNVPYGCMSLYICSYWYVY